MKILFISVQKDIDTIGIKYLHYTLLKKGLDSSILYLPNFNPKDYRHLGYLKEFIQKMEPALIGLSLMSHEYHTAATITEYIKKALRPAPPIIWGGIHPSISPESCLDYADYVSVGESERTILDVATALSRGGDIKSINNICYRNAGKVIKNSLYPLIDNLDEIPPYEHIPTKSYILTEAGIMHLDRKNFRRFARHLGTNYSVFATRGCPFFCTYCCNSFIVNLYHSSKVRKRSVSNLVGELETAVKDNPEIEYINFQDDCFLACGEEYLEEFCKTYKERVGRPFIINAIPVYVTKNKINSLKEAGLAWITVGLQSGSDCVCRDVYKRKSFKKNFLEAANIIKDFGVAAVYDIILDNPFETEEDNLETVDALLKTPKPFYPMFYSLTFYYGTELYERAKSEFAERIEDCLKKDYLIVKDNVINNIIKITPFVSEGVARSVIDLYKRNPRGPRLKAYLYLLNLLITFFLEPVAYLKLIMVSQGGSYLKTFRVLRVYFKEGMRRYFKRFQRQTA